MKKYVIRFFIPIAVIFLIVFFIYRILSENHLRVMSTFYFGQKIERLHFDKNLACNFFLEDAVFCYEGYSEAVLNNGTASTDAKIKLWKNKYPTPSTTELIGAGVAIGRLVDDVPNLEMQIFKKKYFNNHELDFILDGWAFSQMIYKEIDPVDFLSECEKFESNRHRMICAFGFGRSYYFLKKIKNNFKMSRPANANKEIQMSFDRGYGFAKFFAGRESIEDEQNQDRKSGMIVGKTLREIFNKKNTNNIISQCLQKHEHFLFCSY